MIKVGMIGRFPPENITFATYLKNITDHLGKKCKVVKIGLRDSDCDYVLDVTRNIFKTLDEIIKKEKLDVLHIQYIASSDYFARTSGLPLVAHFKTILSNIKLSNAVRKLGIPVVVTLHELNLESKNLKRIIVRWLEKKVIKSSNRVLVHSYKQKEILLQEFSNVEFIRFGLTPKDVEKNGGKNLLYLATIYPSRGLEYLIRAMKYLPDYKLTIKGPAPDISYAGMLQDEIKKMGLENVVLGFDWGTEEERSNLYSQADIVVLPYLWAPNQSAALHDAFSYRTPVVVTDTEGPIDETVKEFNCGVVVGKGSPEKLADGIKIVNENYKSYLKGVDRYRTVANWDSISEMVIKVYEDVVKGVK